MRTVAADAVEGVPSGRLSADERLWVQHAADQVGSLRQVAAGLRRCEAFLDKGAQAPDRPVDAYAIALAVCWGQELRRRRHEIKAEAFGVAFHAARGAVTNGFYRSGGGVPVDRRR